MQTESANTPDPAPKDLVNISIPRPAGDANGEAARAIAAANAFTVTDAESSIMAQEVRAKINTKISTLDEARKTLTRPIDVSKQVIMDFFNAPINVLKQAKAILDGKVLTYDNEQAEIRKEAQRKVEAAAAAERQRLQNEANERQRKADEEAAAKRKAAEDAAAAGRAEEAARLNAQAIAVETRAAARVEVLQERAAQVVAPILQSVSTKASGSSFRDNWKWRLTDKSKVKESFLMTVTNDAAIDAIVKSMKGNAEQIKAVVGAGIEIYNDRSIASKRA